MLPIYLASLIGVGMVTGIFTSLWLAIELEGKKGLISVAIGIFVMLAAIAIIPVML